ncbi:MAG: hypothetical protein HQ485_02370 [Acidobacteria bacterium]|nr:hypothetical protein [Acidobacteriota bacterium]
MSEFQVKSDAVDVDAIMRQIRARVQEKRGADYTETEVQELAKVKLEQFLDPKGVRSDLVAQFRKHRTVTSAPPNYEFEDSTIYETHRGLLRTIRRVLNPLLKLFFNPNRISGALHIQSKVNNDSHQRFLRREDMDALYYELIHNLALEVTRLGIEVHNMKMRVESVSSRVDFDERRGRALEQVVQYKPARSGSQRPPAPRPQTAAAPTSPSTSTEPLSTAAATDTSEAVTSGVSGDSPVSEADGERRRRRRRRRRRPGQTRDEQVTDEQVTGEQVAAPHAVNAPSVSDIGDGPVQGGATVDSPADVGSDEK